MGWVTGQIMRRAGHREEQNSPETPVESSVELRAEQRWALLTEGFKRDVEEFNRHKGNAAFKQISESDFRISTPAASTAVIGSADVDAGIIEYHYGPEDRTTAVPDDRTVPVRRRGRSLDHHAAEQNLIPELA